MPDTLRGIVAALHSDPFLRVMEAVGRLSGLRADPDLEGGGLCEMRPGDFMRPHLDSFAHVTRARWRRRHALFIFLSPDWKEEYGGSLTLWEGHEARPAVRVLPVFNRCVIVGDPAGVFHGVPDAIRCPPGSARRSIAIYYYTEEPEELPLRPTTYQAPGPHKAPSGIGAANQFLVWIYFALKRLRGSSR
jgi:hypothetical protein